MIGRHRAPTGLRCRLERIRTHGIQCNDHFVYPWPRRARDVFFEQIPTLPPGVSEIFAHPVVDGEELRGYDSANADIRTHHLACLTDPAVASSWTGTAITFRELRELQRAG
jgi:hypothetical protein